MLFRSMGQPADLIRRLEETGNVVYPVRNMKNLVSNHHIDSVQPSAVINMAHGRMGDYIVDYLAQQNIPLFSPLNANRLVEKWEDDKMGMNGGFLSQSVVTPEIDGALRPFVVFGHYKDEEGMHHAFAICVPAFPSLSFFPVAAGESCRVRYAFFDRDRKSVV